MAHLVRLWVPSRYANGLQQRASNSHDRRVEAAGRRGMGTAAHGRRELMLRAHSTSPPSFFLWHYGTNATGACGRGHRAARALRLTRGTLHIPLFPPQHAGVVSVKASFAVQSMHSVSAAVYGLGDTTDGCLLVALTPGAQSPPASRGFVVAARRHAPLGAFW